MFALLFWLLLAPFGVLALPASFSLGQLVLELPNSSGVEDEAVPPSSSGVHVDAPSPPPAVTLVYQCKSMRLENLHPRSNGQLLLSPINRPVVYGLDPSKKNSPPTVLQDFSDVEGVTSILGITETAPDVFAVVVGNWTTPEVHLAGSFSVYSLDLNTHGRPSRRKIASLSQASGLNGITTLDAGSPDIVLVAGSTLGILWRVNLTSGDYDQALQSPLFLPGNNNPIGINGVRSYGGSTHPARSN